MSQRKPTAADRKPIALEAHHHVAACSEPDLAAVEEKLLVISYALRRNLRKGIGNRACETNPNPRGIPCPRPC